jgi:hypothetical protein
MPEILAAKVPDLVRIPKDNWLLTIVTKLMSYGFRPYTGMETVIYHMK